MDVAKWSARRGWVLALAAAALVLTVSGAGAQEDAAAFYRGKVIHLFVGYGPGGGFDAYARLIAPHLEQHTGATVVVENRPGGGGLVALNRLVAGDSDGLTLMVVNGQAAALAQLLGQEGVRYDLTRITWLGRLSAEERVLMLSAASPFHTLADARAANRRVKWAAAAKAETLAVWVAIASEALDLNSLIIIGYKGSKEAALAAIRGEVDGIAVTVSSARKYARGGKMRPAVVVARQRAPLLPDVPTVFEAADLSPDKAWWIDYGANLTRLGRAIATAPGVPAERAAFLRRALRAVVTDPAVIAEGRAKGRLFDYAPAQDLAASVAGILGAHNNERLARIRAVVLDKFY